MKKYFFYISILIVVFACKSKNTDKPENHNIIGYEGGVKKEISNPEHNNKQAKFSAEVIKLNEQATLLVNMGDETSYQEAIKLLDEAIQKDTTYYLAYSNKAAILSMLGKHNEAISIYKHIVTNIKPDYPEGFSMLGMLYDKIDEKSIAKEYYEKAIQKYSERIKKNEDVLDMVNKAHLNYILDKQKGLNEIDSLIKVYPNNYELPMYKKYMFLDYNHQKALDDL